MTRLTPALSLPNDVADILSGLEGAERRIDRVLALACRALAADSIALLEVSPVLDRRITVHPQLSPDKRDELAGQLRDVLRLLADTSAMPGMPIAEGQLTVPVTGVGELLGALRVIRSADGFDAGGLGLLSIIASQIGTYLKVVRDARALRQSEERLRKVYEAGLIGVAFADDSGAITEANRPVQQMLGPAETSDALRRAQARLASIISIAADAIITIDDDQRILLYNRGAETIFGYSQEEVLGHSLDKLLPERFRASHREHARAFSRGLVKTRLTGESHRPIFGRRKSGEEFPAEAAISRLESGGTILCTIILRDITERKRTEDEQRFLAEAGSILALSLDQEETLSRIAALAVPTIADCCIVYLNDNEGQVGRVRVACADPDKQAIAKSLEQSPLDPERPYLARSAMEGKQSVLMELVPFEYLQAFGMDDEHPNLLQALAPRSFMAIPLLGRGRCLGALAFISTSPRRRYGPADLRFAEELAHRAALAIDNTALYRAATEAIRTRDDVLAVVAHDLRNPLNAIQLSAKLLDHDLSSVSSTSQGRIDAILRSSERANRLIRDLVDQHRLETGQFQLDRTEFSAAALVLEVIDGQQPMAAAASLVLRADTGNGRSLVADRDRLLQVLENIIGNAMKFTPPGGRISVGVKPQRDEFLFWVNDTGRGIKPEDLPHVFDRFWREDRQDRRGAGLGLSICRGIVEAHAGRIWVESQRAVGTTFFFTIPTARHTAGDGDARGRR